MQEIEPKENSRAALKNISKVSNIETIESTSLPLIIDAKCQRPTLNYFSTTEMLKNVRDRALRKQSRSLKNIKLSDTETC